MGIISLEVSEISSEEGKLKTTVTQKMGKLVLKTGKLALMMGKLAAKMVKLVATEGPTA